MIKSKVFKLSLHEIFSWTFSILFLLICMTIIMSTIVILIQFIFASEALHQHNRLPETVINSISNLIIALAMFELFHVIKIDIKSVSDYATIHALLDSAPRFIIIVCVALALEGLVLVIKNTQSAEPGDLLKPIYLIISASLLLLCLGVFLKICPRGKLESSAGAAQGGLGEAGEDY